MSEQIAGISRADDGTPNVVDVDSNGALLMRGASGAATEATLLDILTTQTDGSAKTVVRGGAKGATVAADVTSTAIDANHQAQDVAEQRAPVAEDNFNGVDGTQWVPLASVTYAPSFYANRGVDATHNIKLSPGNVFAASCMNLNAATRYLQLHNTATVPAPDAVVGAGCEFPVDGAIVGKPGFREVDQTWFTQNGLFFPLGIAYAFSTTSGTYTAGVAGEQSTQVVFK